MMKKLLFSSLHSIKLELAFSFRSTVFSYWILKKTVRFVAVQGGLVISTGVSLTQIAREHQ